LDGLVASQDESPASLDRGAAEEGANGPIESDELPIEAADLVEVDRSSDEAHLPPGSLSQALRETGCRVEDVGTKGLVDSPPKETPESVEAVVPVVVAGGTQEHTPS
jgi:hypothetical protein